MVIFINVAERMNAWWVALLQLLAEFPPNIQSKILETTVRDFFRSVRLMKGFAPTLLNSLAEDVKQLMFLPGDVVVAAGSVAKGLFIVSRLATQTCMMHSLLLTNNCSGAGVRCLCAASTQIRSSARRLVLATTLEKWPW
jgi:hypothetical protein